MITPQRREDGLNAALAPLDKAIVTGVIAAILNHGAGVHDGGAVTAKGCGNGPVGHRKHDMGEIDGDLADMTAGPSPRRALGQICLAGHSEQFRHQSPNNATPQDINRIVAACRHADTARHACVARRWS
tara:strand:- start:29925 stop:30311 length:387 start_codon:yes stop_codon:yes gene_type:complete